MSKKPDVIAAGRGDLKTIAHGLIPTGFNAAALPPEGRNEIKDAIDVILKVSSYQDARLTIAIEQLDKAAAEIDRLRAIIKSFDNQQAKT